MFNIEAYKLLLVPQVDPTPEILKRISQQLGSLTVGLGAPSFINSTLPPYDIDTSPEDKFVPPGYAVPLNILWFISLILSLASGTLGIVVKQWLREYQSGVSGTTPAMARRRQCRLNSLIYWNVAFIIAALPVLLHVAFLLFLAGLLIFLQSLNHHTVTGVVSIPIGVILIFMLGAAFVPSLKRDCCLYSPQAHAIFWLKEKVKWLCMRAFSLLMWVIIKAIRLFVALYPARRNDKRFTQDSLRSLAFITELLVYYPSIWRNAEFRWTDDEVKGSRLDIETISTAYSDSLDINVFAMAEQYTVPDCLGQNSLVAFACRAFETTTRRWGCQWPEMILYRYFRLVNRIIQLSWTVQVGPMQSSTMSAACTSRSQIAAPVNHGTSDTTAAQVPAVRDDGQLRMIKDLDVNLDTLFPASLLRHLALHNAQKSVVGASRNTEQPFHTALWKAYQDFRLILPTSHPFRFVLASIRDTEQALIQETLLSAALLSMQSSPSYDPWDDLVWGVDHKATDRATLRISECTPLGFVSRCRLQCAHVTSVAAVASARFDWAIEVVKNTRSRRQLRHADERKLVGAIDALRLYLRYVTQCSTPSLGPSPDDINIHAIKSHVSSMLSNFRTYILVTPLWSDQLCVKYSSIILPSYDKLIMEIAKLCSLLETPDEVVKCSVREGLLAGLQCIKSAKAIEQRLRDNLAAGVGAGSPSPRE